MSTSARAEGEKEARGGRAADGHQVGLRLGREARAQRGGDLRRVELEDEVPLVVRIAGGGKLFGEVEHDGDAGGPHCLDWEGGGREGD